MTAPRRSPPTQRVVDLLDHVAAHPGDRFGLSELARTLQISKPTCLRIAATLAESGWLDWDEAGKTYGIGPALTHLGRQLGGGRPAAEIAEKHLAELSERYTTSCTASAVVGRQIVILASTDAPGRAPLVGVGQRYPYAPPMGLLHVAWRDDAAVERWLRLGPPGTDADRLRRAVRTGREQGYLVEALSPAGRRLHALVTGVGSLDLPDELRTAVGDMVANLGEREYLTEPGGRSRFDVSVIACPTFDRRGDQELVLSLYVGCSISGAEIARRGRALAATAAAVSAQACGRPAPEDGSRPMTRTGKDER